MKNAMNYVYLLRCRDGSFYCGWTNDLTSRIAAHNSGNGAKYTRSRLPVELVYWEEYDSRHEAMSREWHIKRMSREEKAQLAAQSGKGRMPCGGKAGHADAGVCPVSEKNHCKNMSV